MQLRIVVIDSDPAIRVLLTNQLGALGHDVRTFPDPTACPVFGSSDCFCPRTTPCADLLITEQDLPKMSGLDFLALQKKRGCKAPAENKLLISSSLTSLQEQALDLLGVQSMQKPLVLPVLLKWVERCGERIAAVR